MAVDLRSYNCLPEHQGPAFRTWARIIQTAAMSSGTPTSPLLSPNGYVNSDNTFANLIPAEEVIQLKSTDDTRKQRGFGETSNSGSRKTGHGENQASGSQVVDVPSLLYAPWKKRSYPENAYGLHLEVKDFYEYMSPTPEEAFMRKDAVDRITNVIHSIWPTAKVEIFGSYKTNLYLPTSDIDLVVFGYWEKLPLWTLERALVDQDVADSSTIKVLDKASVPIVKLTDKRSNIKVDISFNMDTAVKGAELIQEFLKEYKILPQLFIVLKHFLVMRQLNEVFTGGISSYCLMLLTISFLQMHPRQESKLPNANLGVLLIEFFELYGRNFNYQRTGIKIRNGGCYCSKDEIMREMVDGQFPSLLCIEDPVSKVIDIGKSSFGIMRVKEAFEYAYNVLDSALRNRHYFKINPDSTYLSRIIHVPSEIVQYREWVKHQFQALYGHTVDKQSLLNRVTHNDLAGTTREVDIVNNDDFPPLESPKPIPKHNKANSSKVVAEKKLAETHQSENKEEQKKNNAASLSNSNQLSLPLDNRLLDTEVGVQSGEEATQDVAGKNNKPEKNSTGNAEAKKNNVVDIESTSSDIDEFILEPYLEGVSWGDLCDDTPVDDNSDTQDVEDKVCQRTGHQIGSGGASLWSGDESSPSENKVAKRPLHLATSHAHFKFHEERNHTGKRSSYHYRNRRPRSPCEGIGEQDLANARQARQLIISSPEKPIIKPEKWAREDGKNPRDHKSHEHNRSHDEKHNEHRFKSSNRDSREYHSENTKNSYDQTYHDDNHSHKYGSGHRRRGKRDSKPF